MEVSGLQLPASLIQLCRAISSGEQAANPTLEHYDGLSFWMLREKVDAYGNPWESDLELWCDLDLIQSRTAELQQWSAPVLGDPEGTAESTQQFGSEAGFIPYIDDFSKIVQFGDLGDGAAVCFDFRENPAEPSVICWIHSVYWRRVAPNFETFIALFRPQTEEDADEEWRAIVVDEERVERAWAEQKLDARLTTEERRELDGLTELAEPSAEQWLRIHELMDRLKPLG